MEARALHHTTFLLLYMILFLSSCSNTENETQTSSDDEQTGNEGTTEVVSVGLLEEWTSSSDLILIRDTSTSTNVSRVRGTGDHYQQYYSNGDRCKCLSISFFGDSSNGSYSVSSCQADMFNAEADPGCDSIATTGTYAKTDSSLTLTPESGSSMIFSSIITSPYTGKSLREAWSSPTDFSVINDTSTDIEKNRVIGTGTHYQKTYPSGDKCNCALLAYFGTQSSGSFTRGHCVPDGSNTETVTDCSILNTHGTYQKTADTLILTPSGESSIEFK